MKVDTQGHRRQRSLYNSCQQNHNFNECNSSRRSVTRDIVLNTLGLTAPMLLLTAALLTFILRYKIDKSTVSPISPGKIESQAIYVDADSTLLVFVSSWMSSLVPFLTAFAIALATYPVAQQLLRDSNDDNHNKLLTSFQLSIAIKFVNGSSWSSLWNLFRYGTTWNKPVIRLGTALVSITVVTSGTVFLGIVIFAADTWLHLATTSVNLIKHESLSPSDAYYSVSILPECSNTNNSYTALKAANLSCSVGTQLSSAVVENVVTTLQTLNNQSETFAILRHPQSLDIHYLSVAPMAINGSYDYKATTFAVSTVCKPISRECNLVLDKHATFNCSNGAFWMEGDDLSLAGIARQSYRYSDMSDFIDDGLPNGVDNPFFTAGAAKNQLSAPLPKNRTQDPELAIAYDTNIAAVFFCNTTVFDVEYEVMENKITRFSTKHSNTSITNMFASSIIGTPFAVGNAKIAMDIAAPSIKSAQDYANAFGESLSAIALASGAASVQRAPIIVGRERIMLLVAQVPKAPLYLLMSVNLSLVVLGLLLAVLAAVTSDEARAVQFRLSIAGIVANLFEGRQARGKANTVEQLFGEYHGDKNDTRIKILRTSVGGFIFKSVEDINDGQNESQAVEEFHGWSRRGEVFPESLPVQLDGLLVEDKVVKDHAAGQTWI